MEAILKSILQRDNSKNCFLKFAPPQGLEPWTYGLTVRRSNQLSYGGKFYLFNAFLVCKSSNELPLFRKAMQR
jgi:hypothetical protein